MPIKTEDLEDAAFFNNYAKSGARWSQDPTCWRYMDLLSLLSILQNESLHLTPLEDLFRYDPSEGTGGLLTNVVNSEITPSIMVVPSNPQIDERNRKEIESIYEELRKSRSEQLPIFKEKVRHWDQENRAVYITCWHTNPIDSDFMWRIYGKMEYGFAIESSVQSLVYSMRDGGIDLSKIGCGFVLYLTQDERIKERPEKSMGSFSSFMIKSPQYEAEKEFRVFVKAKNKVSSCDLRVDLKKLVKSIRISPLVPRWAIKPIATTLGSICSAKGLPDMVLPELSLREL